MELIASNEENITIKTLFSSVFNTDELNDEDEPNDDNYIPYFKNYSELYKTIIKGDTSLLNFCNEDELGCGKSLYNANN